MVILRTSVPCLMKRRAASLTPCATFAGNSTYYDTNPPPWSYPFDQKEDTIQLMNTFASGSSKEARALVFALALPGMLTTWMLNQSAILGQAAVDSKPIAAISDIGQTVVGQPISLDGSASFDPTNASNALNYAWDFGDGATATGATVNHIYNNAGTYILTLTVHSAIGSRQISKVLTIVPKTTVYDNPYAGFKANGIPPSNPAVILPTPNDIPPGQGIPSATTIPTPPLTGSNPVIAFLLIALALALVIAFIVTLVLRRRSKRA